MDESEHGTDTASVSCVHARTWRLLLFVAQSSEHTQGHKSDAVLGANLKTCHPTHHLCSSNAAALFTALHNPQNCHGDFNYVINQSRFFYHVHTCIGIYVCMVLGTEPATFLY